MAGKDEYIRKAYGTLVKMSADEKKQMEYEAREKALRDYQSQMQSAENAGFRGGKEMKKKIISLMLCAVMGASLMTGCGGDSDTSSAASGGANSDGTYSDFITVDVFAGQANYQGLQSGWFAKVVKDKFNMELNIIAPNVAGGGDTLFQTRSAAGDLGDLILTNTDGGRLQNLVTAGLVMDMTDLLADAENVHQYDTAIETVNELAGAEGIYAIPSEVSQSAPTEASESLEPTFGPYLRWDAYKAVGYPEIKDLNGLLDVLKQMQEAVPTSDSGKQTYALSFFKDWDGNMMNNAKQPTCFYGYDELGFVLAKADGSDYQDITASDSMYMKVLEFFYKANQMGLVDPESTTQNYDTIFAKYQDGQPVLTDFGKKALYGEEVAVPEEYGSGNWQDGVSALNFKAENYKDTNSELGVPYDYTLWDSVLAENNTALDLDWQEHMGATTTMEFLENNNKIMVAPGSGFAAPEEDSQITTLRGQCKATIIDTSWQMIFASSDEEFTSQQQMQDTQEGLDYQTVLDYDMDLAHQQNDARVAVVEQYESETGGDEAADTATDSTSAVSSSSTAE